MSLGFDRLGFHYYHDQQHFTQAELGRWLPVFQSLQASWLTLNGSVSKAIPDFFLRALVQAEIKPIVHFKTPIEGLDIRTLRPLLAQYADCGVEYIVLHDRPNMRTSWKPASWARGDLVERFLDIMIPLFEFQAEQGLRPIFPPLEPGGDYWDTAFLRSALGSLRHRGMDELLASLTLGLYQWSYGNPLHWGAGGSAAWTSAQPYNQTGSEDHRGFRIYEWYAAICREIIGTELPMLVLAAGIAPHDQSGTPESEQDLNAIIEILDHVVREELPSKVLNLAIDPHTAAQGLQDRWNNRIERPSPSEGIKARVRKLFAVEGMGASNTAQRKIITHYVLLPLTNQRNLVQDWVDIGSFALAVKPVVGFSLHEAQYAERVTIIGAETDIPKAVEDQLRNAGCDVKRFRMADESELLMMAAELASKNLSSGVVNV